MPIPKSEETTVRAAKTTTAMLKILQGRAFASGENVTYDDLIVYMVETLYPNVYRHVKFGEKLVYGNDDNHQTLIVKDYDVQAPDDKDIPRPGGERT